MRFLFNSVFWLTIVFSHMSWQGESGLGESVTNSVRAELARDDLQTLITLASAQGEASAGGIATMALDAARTECAKDLTRCAQSLRWLGETMLGETLAAKTVSTARAMPRIAVDTLDAQDRATPIARAAKP